MDCSLVSCATQNQARGVMDTILIEYMERFGPSLDDLRLLGQEVHTDIIEVLLPGYDAHDIFMVKSFMGKDPLKWKVEDVIRVSDAGATPAQFRVVLQAAWDSSETFLFDLIQKGITTLAKALRPGTLVEVDFGFVQQVGCSDGGRIDTSRYIDTRMRGEMHKRRLAIVVAVADGLVQVVPTTSRQQPARDKTAFALSDESLSTLARYGKDGVKSWALCRRLQTVPTQRILPPMSLYPRRGTVSRSRNNNYSEVLSAPDLLAFREALGHALGNDHVPRRSLTQAVDECRRRTIERDHAIARAGALEAELERLRPLAQVAQDWGAMMGPGSLERALADLAH